MKQGAGLLAVRNAAAFVAMVALCGAALWSVNALLAFFDIQGPARLLVAFAAAAICGVAGHFLFGGGAALRTWLVFLAVIAFGAVMVVLQDPGRTFYPLLTSLLFAAVAAGATRFTAMHLESRRARRAGAG